MTLVELGAGRFKFTDVAFDATGLVCVAQDEADGDLVFVQLRPDGERRAHDVRIAAGGGNAFPRLYVSPLTKHTWLAWRHETIGGIVLNVSTAQQWSLGDVYGNDPIAFGPEEIWYQATPGYGLHWRSLANLTESHDSKWTGKPDGLASANPVPRLIADVRTSVPGLVNPQRVGRCVVGENASGQNRNIARLEDGREANLWPGLDSFRPRIATDGSQYAVTTWGSGRWRLALLTDRDFFAPQPEPLPPTPTPVPPDIPWTPDPTKTVDLARYVRESATAIKTIVLDGVTYELCWCHKSQEHPKHGEWFLIGPDAVGLVGDTSTGTRMVTHARQADPQLPHKNLVRDRLGRADVEALGLGRWEDLPLAGYVNTPNSLFFQRFVSARWSTTFQTYLDWVDEPQYRSAGGVSGRWELHRVEFTMGAEAGYGRFNGYEVRAKTFYTKPDRQIEHNYWGDQGRIKFEPLLADGTIEVGAVSVRPPGQWTNPREAFVEPPASHLSYHVPITPSPSLPARPLPPDPDAGTPKPPPQKESDPVIQYVELRNLEGRLEDTYQNHGHHPPRTVTTHVDEVGEVWREVYFALRKGGASHEAAMRSIESQIDVIEGRPDRWHTAPPSTPPPTGAGRQIVGSLRVVGRHFHDDHGYISPRGASLLYGLCDGVDPEPVIAQYAAEGIQYVRVFAGELPRIVNGADRGFQQTSAQARERLPRLLDLAANYGLKVQVCAVTDSALVRFEVYEHARLVGEALAHTHDWLEGGNEVEDSEQDHSIDWQRVLNAARSRGFGGLFTVGAGTSDELLGRNGEGGYPLGQIGDFASTHPWRGHEPHWMGDVCRLREGEMISAFLRKAHSFGEPDNGSKQPEGYAFALGALGAGFNAAVVYHSTPGRDVRLFEGEELSKLRAFVAGHRLLEAGPWEFRNAQRPGVWGNSPVVAGAFEEGDYGLPHLLPGGHLWRAFSFVREGKGFTVPIGRRPQDPGAFEIGNGWHVVAERDKRGGVRVIEVAQ